MDGTLIYRERLRVPLRWWVQATMGVISGFLAVVVAMPAAAALVVTAVIAAVVYGFMAWFGSAVVEVHAPSAQHPGGLLVAGRGQLPVSFVSEVLTLDAERTKAVAGREADARAFLVLRGWLDRSVLVRLDDPRDPTPYWLVSTRHPGDLVAAIDRARQTDGVTGSHGGQPAG